ncbi:MAG: SCO2522 family protein [Actinomycetales bacterium]
MTGIEARFEEATARRVVQATPLAHLSVEIGHLYDAELAMTDGELVGYFRRMAAALPASLLPEALVTRRRVSTCLLLDDYSSRSCAPPRDTLPRIIAAAREAEVTIDYLARESACAEAGAARPVELMLAALVVEPPEGTTGARPPVTETGWLCNGTRSPAAAAAMTPTGWRPPRQSAGGPHSIFLDVELWSTDRESSTGAARRWSCPALAAAWQLLRLGLLRTGGRPAWTPAQPPDSWPDDWDAVPALVRLNPSAEAFVAYRTLSVLPVRTLLVEAAVRTILGQVRPDGAVLGQIDDRARAEGITLPREVCDRTGYVFTAD